MVRLERWTRVRGPSEEAVPVSLRPACRALWSVVGRVWLWKQETLHLPSGSPTLEKDR